MENDPKTGKNWCHLPMEMRMECIKQMDLKTRTLLSRTSKLENSLVNSEKYRFDAVAIFWSREEFNISATSQLEVISNGTLPQKRLEATRDMLKTCEIGQLHLIGCQTGRRAVFSTLAEGAPFRIKCFSSDGRDWRTARFFLDNSVNLEKFIIGSVCNPEEFIHHPTILRVKTLLFTGCGRRMRLMCQLIRQWIDIDAAVGKSVQFVTVQDGGAALFASEFTDRILVQTEQLIKIRTNNEKRHIQLRLVGTGPFSKEYISCKVISSDMPASECSGDDEWITNQFNIDYQYSNRN